MIIESHNIYPHYNGTDRFSRTYLILSICPQIRKPLKEKIVNTEENASDKDINKDNIIRDKSKILDICHLNLNEEKLDEALNEKREEIIDKGKFTYTSY